MTPYIVAFVVLLIAILLSSKKKQDKAKRILDNLPEIKEYAILAEFSNSNQHMGVELVDLCFANYQGNHPSCRQSNIVAFAFLPSVFIIHNTIDQPTVKLAIPYTKIGKPEVFSGSVPQLMNLDTAAILANAMVRASATIYTMFQFTDEANMVHDVIFSEIEGATPEEFIKRMYENILYYSI